MKCKRTVFLMIFAVLLTLSSVHLCAAEEGENEIGEEAVCQNGEKNIYGEFYYPDNFDENSTYPTVIMSHGGSVTHEFYEKAGWADFVTDLGYVCYAYDFCGGSDKGKSDGTTTEMTVLTEKNDLYAVLDFVKEQAFCDQEQIYLMGQSFGGFVTGLAAAEKSEEISGVILLYPALSVVDVMHEKYPKAEDLPQGEEEYFGTQVGTQYFKDMYEINVWEALSGYKGDVLIIHGLNDQTIPYTYSVEAIAQSYRESASELILISGKQSLHAFELIYEDGKKQAQNAVENFLETHINEEF